MGGEKVGKGKCEPKPGGKSKTKAQFAQCNIRHCRAFVTFVIGARDGMPVETPPRKVRKRGGGGADARQERGHGETMLPWN